jgi:hypothetical protein
LTVRLQASAAPLPLSPSFLMILGSCCRTLLLMPLHLILPLSKPWPVKPSLVTGQLYAAAVHGHGCSAPLLLPCYAMLCLMCCLGLLVPYSCLSRSTAIQLFAADVCCHCWLLPWHFDACGAYLCLAHDPIDPLDQHILVARLSILLGWCSSHWLSTPVLAGCQLVSLWCLLVIITHSEWLVMILVLYQWLMCMLNG